MKRAHPITLGGASRDGLTSLGIGATLRRLSRHQLLLRLLVVVGPLLTLTATMAARDAFQPIALTVIGALALACAIAPDAHVGLLVLLLMALNWLQTVDDTTTPWLVVAAAGVLVTHTSMAAATVAPPAATWESEMARRWLWRAGVVMAATAVAWVAAIALVGADVRGNAIVLVAGLLLAGGFASWTRFRSVNS